MKGLIGLGHKKRHGKSTVAEYLAYNYDWGEYAFATAVKNTTDSAFKFPAEYKFNKELLYTPLNMSYREALQKVGESFRASFGEDIWIKNLEIGIQDVRKFYNVVISDVRYLNEAEWVKNQGGILINIVNPRLLSSDKHISEISLDSYKWDYVILNNGSKRALLHKIDNLVTEIFNEKLA